MNSTTRLFTSAVRCVAGSTHASAARSCRPLFQDTTRTFMAPASTSTSLSSLFRNRNTALSVGRQTTTSDYEQRRFRSNRSKRGLYDGKDIRTGNNLSFSMRHTKRTFKPNVFIKKVYSEILDEMVRFHLTTSTLRTIDKCGGLDNYLLTSKHVTSGEGLKTKKRIMNELKYRERKAKPQEEASA